MKRRYAFTIVCAAMSGQMLAPLLSFAEQRTTWTTYSAWVRELNAEEQRIVILFLENDFFNHFKTKIAPANQDTVAGAIWSIKMFGWSRFFLSELATKNDDMRRFFKQDADDVRALTTNWNAEKWAEEGKKTQRKISEWSKTVRQHVRDQVMNDYAKKLKSTSDYLIVESMGGASLKN